MSRLSVVVPVLNDARHLERLLQALAAQSLPAGEVIVVDNGCSDDSEQVARRAGARVIREPRRGIAPAAAAGYDAATGELIIRCDADTIPGPGWLRRIAGRFDADPRLSALTGPGYFNNLPLGTRTAASLFYSLAYFAGLGAALARVPLWGSNMAFRRATWRQVRERVHLHVPGIHDDLDFSCNLPRDARVAFDHRLRVQAAGRVFTRPAGVSDSVRRVASTLHANGGPQLILRRWSRRLGLSADA